MQIEQCRCQSIQPAALHEVQYIVNDSNASILFVGNESQFDIACEIASSCQNLKQIVVFDDSVDIAKAPIHAMHWSDVLALGKAASQMCRDTVAARTAAATDKDIATLIYTSGTTGEPKGAVLPHSCFNTAIRLHHQRLTQLSDKDTSMCFPSVEPYLCKKRGHTSALIWACWST